MNKLNQVLLNADIQVGADLFAWIQQGGTEGLAVALKSPETIIQRIADADLRGMGGAGFPTARKWEAAANAVGDSKKVVCNGNEDEPGTFKDRHLLRHTPHQVIEGALIAALAIGASGLAFDFRSRIAVALVTAIALALTRFWPTLAAWPRLPLLGWLGNISYSVFLIHFPVCLLINAVFERFVPHTPGLQLFGMLVAWACSLAAGALFHQKIELPAQRWLSSQRSPA